MALVHPLYASQNKHILLTIVGENSQFSCHRGRVQLRITVIRDDIEFPDLDPVEISENAGDGSIVTRIQAMGGGSGTGISYSFGNGNTGNAFAIDSTTGTITVARALDFEVQGLYNLTVIGTSIRHGNSESAVQVVQVLDVNELPSFTNSCAATTVGVCDLTVLENEPNGTTVGILTAMDPDLSTLPNGQITFSLDSVSPPAGFSLIQVDKMVTLVKNDIFDREEVPTFSLVIRVTDGGSPPLSSILMVRVFVEDVNDNAPEFIQAPSLLLLPESTMVGTPIGQYEATDRDVGVNAQITYSITSNSVVLAFEINPITGLLRVSSPLDFETVRGYVITVTASNPDGLSTSVSTPIGIVDENDNPPIFSQSVYNTSVSEGDPAETFVLQVEATDADSGLQGAFNFSIKDGNFNNSFVINEDGAIFLANEVDRETIQVFTLTICAVDFGIVSMSSVATVVVNVIDVNDNPPVFVQDRYEVILNEDTEPVDILTVTALDRDEPFSPNSAITFSLDESTNVGMVFNLTQVNNNNAILRLIGQLDFETLDHYILRITATDGGSPSFSTEAIVVVNVTDGNEFPPVVSQNITIDVPESAPTGSRITQVNVSSLNNVNQSFVIVSVTEPGASGNSGTTFFDIDSDGFVRIVQELDFETTESYTVTIQVTDGTSSATVIVTVNIIDVNEFPPEFEGIGNFSVLEEEPIGTAVGTVTAVDGDTGPMSNITYAIFQDSLVASLFNIDPMTGEIITAAVLDREQLVEQNLFLPSAGSAEVITVVATDSVTPFRSSTFDVTIVLVDINDNSPIIQSFPIFSRVDENQMEGEFVARVVATDRDIGINAEINFSSDVVVPIIPLGQDDPFVIDSSGTITTASALDAEETSIYVVSVVAFDRGQPSLNSSTSIVVRVTDLNDNTPVFSRDSYEVTVPEDIHLRSGIVILDATDADISPSNSEVSFTIVFSDPPNSIDVFNITSNGGNSALITVVQQPDFESVPSYFLVVEAVDNGNPSLFSTANVTVIIGNVDEVPPAFQSPCEVGILENTIDPGFPVTQCSVFDISEVNGLPLFDVPLTFEFISGNVNNTFSVLMDGTIIMERVVDREILDFYSILLEVSDPSGLTVSSFVNVTILDINDNAPIITNEDLSQTVSTADIEDGETNFFTVLATDADIGDFAELSFMLDNFVVSVDGMNVSISVTVADPSFSTSAVINLNFETPCFLQDHMINATDGRLTSRLMCMTSLVPAELDIPFGGTLELQCSVLANILPSNFEFIHNSSVVPSMDSNLTIENVTFEAGGVYACKVMSDIGNLQSTNGIVRVLCKCVV